MRKPFSSTRAGDPEVSDLIDEFTVGLAEQVDRLQDVEFKDDLQELGTLTRALAGRAETLGFELFAASAMDLEGCCRTGDSDGAREALIELTEIAKKIRTGHRGSV